MEPESGKLFSSDAFRLSDFVFVMWENQIYAPGMDVQSIAKILHGHGRAFNVPTRTAIANGSLPRRFAILLHLP